MELHESIVKSLQEGVDYFNGDKTKATSRIVTDDGFIMKCTKLHDDEKQIIEAFVDKLLVARQA